MIGARLDRSALVGFRVPFLPDNNIDLDNSELELAHGLLDFSTHQLLTASGSMPLSTRVCLKQESTQTGSESQHHLRSPVALCPIWPS